RSSDLVLEAGPVDLLAGCLADVAQHQVAGAAVEGEAERVAQSEPPDRPGDARVRVARRHRVAAAGRRMRVDPQDLAELAAEILGVAELVVAATAVARPDPQHPVRAELDRAAV